MIEHNSNDCRRIERAGFHVMLSDAAPQQVGAVTSRFVGRVVTAGGRQVGVFRCTREGDYLRWGWVEHADGQGRTEYVRLMDFLAALEAHPLAAKRTVER